MIDKLFALPDWWLNRVTMYRLVIYYLCFVLGVALVLSVRGTLGYRPIDLIGTTAVAVSACLAVNALFAQTFGSPMNSDSAAITGLILALIVGPAHATEEYVFLGWAAALAMATKYIVALHKVHLFNPAALALVITGAFARQPASWWVGTASLTPYVIVGGLLVVRKLRRGDLVRCFLWATLFATLAWSAVDGVLWRQALRQDVLESSVWFLAFVMLTEPVTLPSTRRLQIVYGLLAGLLVVPQLHLGHYYLTPELALVAANAAMIPFRSRAKRVLYPDRAFAIGPGLVDFVYRLSPPLAFQPGQYMEWTLDHAHPDSRGKRRFFTLASSPTEATLRVGVKIEEAGSTFKQELAAHAARRLPIVAALVAGDFTLPRDREQKLAFIAGGIGITPFRSMVKYLTDRGEDRDVVLLYANRRFEEIVYGNVFQAAEQTFRFRPVYVLSDPSSAPPYWRGEIGRIDAAMIARQIPDYHERLFYVSGSPQLVQAAKDALHRLSVRHEQIKTDYFSGLAA
jgi:glycine betaine catabolism B